MERNEKTNRMGLFIVLEGIDGSGKSTIAKSLVGYFLEQNIDCIYTTEPTQEEFGKKFREGLQNNKTDPLMDTYLLSVDRYLHSKNVIMPSLKQNKVIICDRYIRSNMAYQHLSGIDIKWVDMLNLYCALPDLEIFIRVKPDEANKRIERRLLESKEQTKRTKYETIENLIKLNKNFESIYNREIFDISLLTLNVEKTFIVDSTETKEVFDTCLEQIYERFPYTLRHIKKLK
jgi:dTMP kinase